jgi:hypothetical protein
LSQLQKSWIVDDLKCEAIFNINVVNFLIIHVTIDFDVNYIKIYECVLRKKWTHNELLQ